jgi:DNA-binding beta-propeller fold protein YncE
MTLQSKASAIVAAVVAASALAGPAAAQLAVSANENKITLVDGVQTVVRNPPPDTVTIVDLSGPQPKVVAEIPAPTSVVGPPSSVAIAPDGTIALVTAATKIDPADPTKTLPNDAVTVIDLKASPPAAIATVRAGSGASGVSINPAGTLALVANRIEGTISILVIRGKSVSPVGKVDLGAPDSGPSHVAFTRGGKGALVTRNNDSLISLLSVDGTTVSYAKRDVGAGFKPYGLEVAPAGDVAIVGNIGAGQTGGGVDVINVIDLTGAAPRTVAHVTAGPTVESVAISADGRYVAAMVMNGSSSPKASPTFNDYSLLKVYSLAKKTLTAVTEARIGHWCQGTAWGRDGKTLLVQCMVEREIQVFTFNGRTLTRGAVLKVNGGPAGIRTN